MRQSAQSHLRVRWYAPEMHRLVQRALRGDAGTQEQRVGERRGRGRMSSLHAMRARGARVRSELAGTAKAVRDELLLTQRLVSGGGNAIQRARRRVLPTRALPLTSTRASPASSIRRRAVCTMCAPRASRRTRLCPPPRVPTACSPHTRIVRSCCRWAVAHRASRLGISRCSCTP